MYTNSATMENSYEGSSKNTKLKLQYNLAILLLGIYTKKVKTGYWKGICTSRFMEELFMTGKIQKYPKCVATDE